jgi:hypothetical protein
MWCLHVTHRLLNDTLEIEKKLQQTVTEQPTLSQLSLAGRSRCTKSCPRYASTNKQMRPTIQIATKQDFNCSQNPSLSSGVQMRSRLVMGHQNLAMARKRLMISQRMPNINHEVSLPSFV